MGKNSKTRRRNDRDEMKPVVDVGVDRDEDDSEQLRAIRIERKLAAAALLRQLLGTSRPELLVNEDGYDDLIDTEQLNDVSDTVASDWLLSGRRMPPDGSDSSGGEETWSPDDDSNFHHRRSQPQSQDEHLPSRKLVLRQMVMNQLNVMQRQQQQQSGSVSKANVGRTGEGRIIPGADQELDEAASEADSWLEMEERFAEIYEPIPFNVGMDSWRSMTKQQMLRTVNSRRLRSSMQHMSRTQILAQIRTIKVQRNGHASTSTNGHQANSSSKSEPVKINHKNPVYEDMSGSLAPKPPPIVAQQQQHRHKSDRKTKTSKKPAHHQRADSHFYQNTAAYDGETLADIYEAKVEAHRQLLRLQQQQQQHQSSENGLYVTRALVHATPYDSDDVDGSEGQNRKHFVSRSDIVNKWSGGAAVKTGVTTTGDEHPQRLGHLVVQKSRSQMMEELRRQSDYITTVYSVGGALDGPLTKTMGNGNSNGKEKKDCDAKSCTSSCPSDCDGGVCDDDNCSLCSCSSCGTFNGSDQEEENNQDISNGLEQHQQQQRQRTEVAEQSRSRGKSPIMDVAASVPPLENDTRRTKNKKKKEKSKKNLTSASPIGSDNNDERRRRGSKIRNESNASTPEPVPLNLVKQRRMEFERLRILDEQETRLKELVRRQQQQQHHNDVDENQVQTWSTLARRARLLEERWNQAQQRGHGHVDTDDEVVDSGGSEDEQPSGLLMGDSGSASDDVNKRKRKQRTKLIQQLKNRMRQNLAAVSLDPRVRQRRHQKLKQLLNDALHAGTQTLSNINLGLIYVPPLIDDSASNNSTPSLETGPKPGNKSQQGKAINVKKQKKMKPGNDVQDVGGEEENEEDVFGSIDTLIFEPKNSSLDRPSSSAATTNEDDLTDVERKIAQQFDYLYDSQYGDTQSDMDTEPRRTKSAAATGEESFNSKNVQQAAAAGVVAAAVASSTVNLPSLTANSFGTKAPLLHQQPQSAVGTTMAIVAASAETKKVVTVTAAAAATTATPTTSSIRSCAAAASCDVSASCKMVPGHIPPPPPLPNTNPAVAIASIPVSNNSSIDSDSDNDTTSNISFGSVIYQGQKLLDLAQKQQQKQRETGLVSQLSTGEKDGRSQLPLRRQPPLHPPPPPPSAPESRNGTVSVNDGSVCFDSEQYTNVDTDASWDYYPDRDALSDGDQDDQELCKSANRPDEGKSVGPALTVGNLRKRPTKDQSSGNMLGHHLYGHDAEADETARLLESLRMAEDSHVSTSLRLIFPPDGSKHRLVPSFQLDIAPDTVNYHQHLMSNRAAPEPTTLIDEFGSPVTHFRSLPELSQVVNFASVSQSEAKKQATHVPPFVRSSFQPHVGIRKRDTMIRELKLKLKLRDRQRQKTRSNDCGGPADSILKKPKTALDKLESILSSFSSLAEMKAEGHIYRTANELRQQQHQQQPLSLPEYSTTSTLLPAAASGAVGNGITEYDIPAILSTGYPHHLLYRILANNNQQRLQQLQSMESMSDEPTTIYDPSLPGDIADFESLAQLQNQHVRSGGEYSQEINPYYHEGLYSISEPLMEKNARSPTTRRNRRRRKKGHGKANRTGQTLNSEQQQQQDNGGCDSGAESTWSDMENRIFAMNNVGGDFDLGPLPHPLFAAADQMLQPPPPPVPHHHQQQHFQQPPLVTNNRMAPYHGDEWLFWDQLHQWRRTMVDQQRWEEEKARRMLLWIHHSQDPMAALASLGQLAAVGNGVGGGYPTATSLPHLPHWWQVD